jgi:ribonuclease-3
MRVRHWVERLSRGRRLASLEPAVRTGVVEFEAHIGYHFSRPEIVALALTHRSFLNSNGGEAQDSNERLEFLGDSVLELVVNEYLAAIPASRRAAHQDEVLLVSRNVLADQAKRLPGRFLFLSDAERTRGSFAPPSSPAASRR